MSCWNSAHWRRRHIEKGLRTSPRPPHPEAAPRRTRFAADSARMRATVRGVSRRPTLRHGSCPVPGPPSSAPRCLPGLAIPIPPPPRAPPPPPPPPGSLSSRPRDHASPGALTHRAESCPKRAKMPARKGAFSQRIVLHSLVAWTFAIGDTWTAPAPRLQSQLMKSWMP